MNALDEVASIGADLRAWLEWQESLGAAALPKETIVAAPVVDDIQPPRSSRPAKKDVPRDPVPSAPKMVGRGQPVQKQPVKPDAGKPVVLSDKWKALMDGPTTHRVQGPAGAALLIVRGSGSSMEAEAMLDRMLENVLGIARANVCIVDLIRDARPPSTIGVGFLDALPSLQPKMVLLMGQFAVQAICGESQKVQDQRGRWQMLDCGGVELPMRVSHHTEAILLLAARGQRGAKREAFADLQAVHGRLTSV